MKCILCNSKKKYNFQSVINLGNQPIANNLIIKKKKKIKTFPLNLVLCKKCDLVQTSIQLSPKKIFNKNYPYLSSQSKLYTYHAKNLANEVINKFKVNKNDLILEVGSNDGYLLQYFNEKKYNSLGIEPTKIAYKKAKQNGIKTLNIFFNYENSKKIVKKFGKSKILISNNTIAHVKNINSFFKGFKIILDKHGVAIFEFQYLINLIKNNLIDNIYHEHYLYYSIQSLSNLLKKFDLEIFDILKIDTHGGSLRVYVKHKINNKQKISQSVKKYINLEKKYDLKNKRVINNFQKKITKMKQKIKKFMSKHKKKKFIAYGAPAKATTFLNYFKSINKISYVIDQAKSKQNKFIPGVNLKIISDKKIDMYKYDIIIILAWNLKNEIIKYIKLNYPEKKFQFIIFVPDLKIIS